MGTHAIQVIAITGGKGGVGKSNCAVNLGVSLANMGRRVILMDADLGLANLDVLLGLSPGKNLSHVLSGECRLADTLVEGPSGVRIVPASSGTQSMVSLSSAEHAGLIHAFSEISHDVDVLIIDTAAGISEGVVQFVKAAQETLFVVEDEPTSITDAYAMIKLLSKSYDMHRFHILANMVTSEHEGRQLHAKLTQATDRFLTVNLQYAGAIPYDENLSKAVKKQRAVCDLYPQSKSSIAFKALAKNVDAWPMPATPRGHLEFFVERLLGQVVNH